MKLLTPLLCFLFAQGIAIAQEPAELSERRQAWETQRTEAQEKIDNLYFEELEELKKNFTQASNITDALAVDNVIKGSDKADNEPVELTKVRLARDKSLKKVLKPLDKRYWQDLKKLKEGFIKEGKLDGVVIANAEIEKVLAAYKKPEPPKKKTEVAKEKAEEKQADAPKANNNPKAAAILEQAMGKDAQFQYDLAQRYFKGDGVDKDEKTAIKLMQMAADQNNGIACANLSLRYVRGVGVRRDKKRAAELIAKKPSQADIGKAVGYMRLPGTILKETAYPETTQRGLSISANPQS